MNRSSVNALIVLVAVVIHVALGAWSGTTSVNDGLGAEGPIYAAMVTDHDVQRGTAVQRLTEQGLELFGGMGVIQGMPIEKYVRDAIVQKHISFPFPTRYRITEALTGYKRKQTPYLGNT